MENKPRLLFFCRDAAPSKAEAEDIKKQVARGFRVDIRNAIYAKTDGALEPADAVAGEATPTIYQDAYPWADDFDPDDVPEVGTEWVDDDGIAWVRAVRGDGVAYNMPLSIAAPAAIGSGAPTHGPFAGVDHAARILAAQADRDDDKGDGEGDGEGQGDGAAETGQNGGQDGQGGQGGGGSSPPASQQPPVKPAAGKAKRRATNWKRNA